MSRTVYNRSYKNFLGVDMSSDPRGVDINRLSYSVNMWRDYSSEQGMAIETIPGFRRVATALGGSVHGMWHYRTLSGVEYIAVHAGTMLYMFELEDLRAGGYLDVSSREAVFDSLADCDSQGFIFNNNLYVLDGSCIWEIRNPEGESVVRSVSDNAYVPTTFYNGYPYEQRNMLSNKVYVKDSGGAKGSVFDFLEVEITGKVNDESDTLHVKGFTEEFIAQGLSLDYLILPDTDKAHKLAVDEGAFEGSSIKGLLIRGNWSIGASAFKDCESLKYIYLSGNIEYGEGVFSGGSTLEALHLDIDGGSVSFGVFSKCESISAVYINGTTISQNFVNCEIGSVYIFGSASLQGTFGNCNIGEVYINDTSFTSMGGFSSSSVRTVYFVGSGDISGHFAAGTEITYNCDPQETPEPRTAVSDDYKYHTVYDMAKELIEGRANEVVLDDVFCVYKEVDNKGEKVTALYSIAERGYIGKLEGAEFVFELECYPTHFTVNSEYSDFAAANPAYEMTDAKDALHGCTKCAIYDGRIFLTGNPDLPNTVFYSQRNDTGENDPSYFGVYNYFNDGDGNTPNVDLLSTPSMLMVIKRDTVQDASVYYHTGADNTTTDGNLNNLIPRVYPSVKGAAGLGSAAQLSSAPLCCNFYDDPVFISKRGLEAIGKEAVNLERTVVHRSSNVDRLLTSEDLSKASLAEWCGYLVIACEGHIYLADSRKLSAHSDGSYQYEWFYLENVGTYSAYSPAHRHREIMPYIYIEQSGETVSLGEFTSGGKLISEVYSVLGVDEYVDGALTVYRATAHLGEAVTNFNYVEMDGVKYIVGVDTDELIPVGEFFGVRRVVSAGELLFFGTGNGDLCLFNTDKRGVSVGGELIERDRIHRSFYTFGGVRYTSGCSTRLDDLGNISYTKTTLPRTAVGVFKSLSGSRCTVMISRDGREWRELMRFTSSRFSFADIDFSNISFAENENNIVLFPEWMRNYPCKQYHFYSDGYEEPFGLYEVSFSYYLSGKIKY